MDVPEHHKKQTVCGTRLPYREGRIPKAVKVYTVNNESRYLLVQGVPSVGATSNLSQLFSQFGAVEEHHALDEYPCEDKYTEVYLFKYKRIQSARFAKKKLDDYSFFGGILHVCYAPEHETVQETREKLQDRQRVVAHKIRQHAQVPRPQNAHVKSREQLSIMNDKQLTRSDDTVAPHGEQPEKCPPSLPHSKPHPATSHNPVNPASIAHMQVTITTPHRHLSTTNSVSQGNIPNFQIEGEAPQQTFEIPPPPKESISGKPNRFVRNKNQEFARAPALHTGFHGRFTSTTAQTDSQFSNIPRSRNNFKQGKDSLLAANKSSKSSNEQQPIIVKNYKKEGRPAPKFVPRQAMKRKSDDITTDDGKKSKTSKSPEEELIDQQLRENAFKLGKVQGPENVTVKEVPVKVDPNIDKSMINTIRSIRSKISQVISDTVNKSS